MVFDFILPNGCSIQFAVYADGNGVFSKRGAERRGEERGGKKRKGEERRGEERRRKHE